TKALNRSSDIWGDSADGRKVRMPRLAPTHRGSGVFLATSTLWQPKSPKIVRGTLRHAHGTSRSNSLTTSQSDDFPSSILPPYAFRAPRARRIRLGGGADRGAHLGAPPRLPGAQSRRNHASIGRRPASAGAWRSDHRRVPRRGLWREPRPAA